MDDASEEPSVDASSTVDPPSPSAPLSTIAASPSVVAPSVVALSVSESLTLASAMGVLLSCPVASGTVEASVVVVELLLLEQAFMAPPPHAATPNANAQAFRLRMWCGYHAVLYYPREM